MKKFVFIGYVSAALFALAACNNPTPPNSTGPGPIDESGPICPKEGCK